MGQRKCCRKKPCIACLGGNYPTALELTIAGITSAGGGCSGCSLMNGTWTINKSGDVYIDNAGACHQDYTTTFEDVFPCPSWPIPSAFCISLTISWNPTTREPVYTPALSRSIIGTFGMGCEYWEPALWTEENINIPYDCEDFTSLSLRVGAIGFCITDGVTALLSTPRGATLIVSRSDPEQAALLAICQTCEHFTGAACKLCGCASQQDAVFQSKLRVGQCPKGKWTTRR